MVISKQQLLKNLEKTKDTELLCLQFDISYNTDKPPNENEGVFKIINIDTNEIIWEAS